MIEFFGRKAAVLRVPEKEVGSETAKTIEVSLSSDLGFTGDVPILSDVFENNLNQLGFKHYKAGTFKSESGGAYVYRKNHVIFASLDEAKRMLGIVHILTAKGLLYPATRWGVVERKTGNFQLVAVTRSLARVTEGPKDVWNTLRRPLGYELFERAGIPDECIQTELDNPMSLIHHLDMGEAAHGNNWAWSVEDQKYYPIDVEVIMLGGDLQMQKSHADALEIERRNQKPREIIQL